MKEKLEVIRNYINDIAVNGHAGSDVQVAKKATALLDSLIAELDSEELVEKVNNIIDSQRYEQTIDSMDIAEAAINAIKGVTVNKE